MINHYAEPIDRTTGHIAQQCDAPDGSTGSFLFSGNIKVNPVLLSPVFQETGKLLVWLAENGWRKKHAGLLEPYCKAGV